MKRRPALVLALMVGGLAACGTDGPTGTGEAPVGFVRSSIDGQLLDPARLDRIRAVAQGCLFGLPAEDGTWRVHSVPRRFLPFRLPRVPAASNASGRAPGRVAHLGLRLGKGDPQIGMTCIVPAELSDAELVSLVESSHANAQWARVLARTFAAPAMVRSTTIQLSAEAREAHHELLASRPASTVGRLQMRASIDCVPVGPAQCIQGTTITATAPPPAEPPPSDSWLNNGWNTDYDWSSAYADDMDTGGHAYLDSDDGDSPSGECQWDCGTPPPPPPESSACGPIPDDPFCIPDKLDPTDPDFATVKNEADRLSKLDGECGRIGLTLSNKLAAGQVSLFYSADQALAGHYHLPGFSSYPGEIHLNTNADPAQRDYARTARHESAHALGYLHSDDPNHVAGTKTADDMTAQCAPKGT